MKKLRRLLIALGIVIIVVVGSIIGVKVDRKAHTTLYDKDNLYIEVIQDKSLYRVFYGKDFTKKADIKPNDTIVMIVYPCEFNKVDYQLKVSQSGLDKLFGNEEIKLYITIY